MKNVNRNIAQWCLILVMPIACLTASCAKKYGCYYSAAPVDSPASESLMPTGAQTECDAIPYPGAPIPHPTDVPAGLK